MCHSCIHWQATDRAADFAAPCAVGMYSGRVAFDRADPPCMQHSARPQTAPTVPPVNAPPLSIAQMWKQAP